MEDLRRPARPRYRQVTIAAGVLLAILYICFAAGFVISGHRIPISAARSSVQTPTEAVASTPHLLVHLPPDPSIVSSNDFSSGIGTWSLLYADGKLQDINGEIVLQSYLMNHGAAAVNAEFLSPGPRYYVQADFATDRPPTGRYGLLFGVDEQSGTLYFFGIVPAQGSAGLWKISQNQWQQLVEPTAVHLNSDMEQNTLSVYFDSGHLQLYANGILVFAYVDNDPLWSNGVGAYVSNPEFKLLVDNFFGYSLK